MPLPYNENFDGLTPPALPSGWNATGSTWTSATTVHGVAPQSSPNMLQLSTTATGAFTYTFATADGNGGSVVAQVDVNGTDGTSATGTLGGTVQGSAATLSFGVASYYAYWANFATGQVGITYWNGASQTTVASLTAGSWPSGWKRLKLTRSGTSLSLEVFDYGTSDYLASSGSWQATQTTALSATDSSLSGSGYAGLYVVKSTGSQLYADFDNWSLSSATATSSTGTIAATEGGDVGVFSGTFKSSGTLSVTEGGDVGAFSGFACNAILTTTEGGDTFAASGGMTAPGAWSILESPDVAALIAFFRAGAIATTEGADVAAFAGASIAAGTLTPTGHADAASLAGIAYPPGGRMAVTEGGDTASFSGSGAIIRGTLSATEGGDTGAFAANVTVHAALAVIEAGDRGAIQAVALGVPPSFKVKEAGDVASFLGSSPTLHYNVYMSPGPDQPIDYSAPVATTSGLTWTSPRLDPGGTWGVGVRATNAFGEERNLSTSVFIDLDENGDDVSDIPPPPSGLRAFATKGAKIKVEWSAGVATSGGAATEYRVYWGTGGTPDYGSPVATIQANTAILGTYQATLSGTDGVTYAIAVRAANASGTETNQTTVSVTADGTGPLPVSGLTATTT